MCKIFDEVWEEGRDEGRKELLNAIKNLMIALNLTFKDAMNLLKIPDDKQAELMKLI